MVIFHAKENTCNYWESEAVEYIMKIGDELTPILGEQSNSTFNRDYLPWSIENSALELNHRISYREYEGIY